jgi:DNA-nicking Smr family endonuclease
VSRAPQTLKDLAALKDALERTRRAAAAEQARAREHAQRERRDARLFETSVGPVHRLKDHGRADVARPRPAPVALQRALDEQAALLSAWSDDLDVESLLETDDALSFRRRDIAPDVLRRLRRGQWAIQDQIDLHGMNRDEARERLAEFVRDSVQRGLRCVRVVHGKGHGSPGRTPVLKGKVRAWLTQKEDVAAFTQARPAEGGAGAIVVLLRGGSGT